LTRLSSAHVERISLLPALAVAVPAVVAFLALAVFVVGEAGGAQPFAVAPAANVAEAVVSGDAGQALAFIMLGQDPNQRWPIRRDLLDSRGVVHVTAIQAAILGRRQELVGLMLRHGARPETPEGLACLAQAVEKGEELQPSVFGVADREYYRGPRIGGMEALSRCGFPAD
jgi:hypothetical protein